MLAQNSLFIVGFCTAFIWAGVAAYFLYKKDEVWSRAAAVPFGMLAAQSIFWLVVCLMIVPMFAYTDFAENWMWLMGGGAIPWWISSLLGTIVGVVVEIKTYGKGDGIWVAILSTLGCMILYGFFLLLAWMVTSVQAMPIILG